MIQKNTHGTILGVALNYKGHYAENLESFKKPPYQSPPTRSVLFIKTPNTRNHNGGSVSLPKEEQLFPGPSLAVIIGKDASRIKADNAYEYILGYTIANEFTLPEESYYRPAIKAKCRDGFCVLGDNIVLKDQVADPHQLDIKLFVNGKEVQSNNSQNLIRKIPQLIEEITEFMTLYEGDILLTGFPEGRVEVKDGDLVSVTITGLGELKNTIVTE